MKLIDVLKEAEYTDIVLSLLSEPYKILSVTKIIFISFCVYHESNFSSYKNRQKDFVDVFFKNISFNLAIYYKDIEKIIHILCILEKTNKIKIIEDTILIIEDIKHDSENIFIKKCCNKLPNPIIEIDKLDALAMIEEVIRYV